jgi:hypothetical protein
MHAGRHDDRGESQAACRRRRYAAPVGAILASLLRLSCRLLRSLLL